MPTETDTVKDELDENQCPTQEQVTPEQMAQVKLRPEEFHGEWNYTILPHESSFSLLMRDALVHRIAREEQLRRLAILSKP